MRIRIVIALHGSSPEKMPLLRWTIVRLIETLRESPVPVTVEIEEDP